MHQSFSFTLSKSTVGEIHLFKFNLWKYLKEQIQVLNSLFLKFSFWKYTPVLSPSLWMHQSFSCIKVLKLKLPQLSLCKNALLWRLLYILISPKIEYEKVFSKENISRCNQLYNNCYRICKVCNRGIKAIWVFYCIQLQLSLTSNGSGTETFIAKGGTHFGRQFSSKSKSRLQIHWIWIATTPPRNRSKII